MRERNVSFPGNELRALREQRELTLDAVSQECAIASDVLSALEDGVLERLPAECFTVGFLRSYCHFLNVDAAPYVRALKENTSSGKLKSEKQPAKPARSPIPRFWLPEISMRVSPEFKSWLAAVGVMLLGWFAYTVVFEPAPAANEGLVAASTLDLRVPDSYEDR